MKRWRCLILCSIVACGEPPRVADSPDVPGATASVAGTPPAPRADPNALPALVMDARAPCEIAKAERDAGASALKDGRPARAVRLAKRAATRCPADAAAAQELETRAKADLAGDAGRSATVWLAESQSAATQGDAVLARKLRARAVARLESETSGAARLMPVVDPSRELAAASRDGSRFILRTVEARRADQETLAVVSSETLRPLRFIDVRDVVDVALSGDGKIVAATLRSGEIHFWSEGAGKPLVSSGKVPATIEFAPPSEDLIAVYEGDAMGIDMVAAKTGERRSVGSPKLKGAVKALAVSGDGARIAIATAASVELWDVKGAKTVATFPATASEEIDGVALSKSGTRLAIGTGEGMAIWSAGRKKPDITHPADIGTRLGGLSFDAADTRVRQLFHRNQVELQIHGLQNDGETRRIDVTRVGFNTWQDGSAGLVRGGRAIADTVEGIIVLDADQLAETGRAPRLGELQEKTHTGGVRTFLCGSEGESMLRILDRRGLRALPLPPPLGTGIDPQRMALSRDGRRLAWGGRETVLLSSTDEPKATEVTMRKPLSMSLAFPGEGHLLAAISIAGKGAVYRVDGGGAPTRLLELGGYVWGISPTGRNAIVDVGNSQVVVDLSDPTARTPLHGQALNVPFSMRGDHLFDYETAKGLTRRSADGSRVTGETATVVCKSSVEVATNDDGTVALVHCHEDKTSPTELWMVRYEESKTPAVKRLEAVPKDARYGGVKLTPHGDLVFAPDEDGFVDILDARDGSRVATLRFAFDRDAALLVAADGRFQLLGKESSILPAQLACRIGQHALPFEACADGLEDEGLLSEILGAPVPDQP